ncbi:MAG: hypothetical protein K5985_09990 [Lachnospiraceae bacterium]|nr:hypothetical protein [Lachnospiraceae bacterium]
MRTGSRGRTYSSRRVAGGGKRYYTETEYYITDGSAVRISVPDYYEQSMPGLSRRPSITVAKNRAKAAHMNPGYILFLCLALFICAAAAIAYVNLRSENTALMKQATKLEGTYNEMKQSNDEEFNRIKASINMEEIKRIAMEELGMRYPDEEQVVDISGKSEDYVRQYRKIPEAEK